MYTQTQWQNMSYKKRRLLVMKDILQRLDDKLYIPAPGDYIQRALFTGHDCKKDIWEIVNANSCKVCIIGATFLSCVNLIDSVIYDTERISTTTFNIICKSSSAVTLVKTVFTDMQWAMVEAIFEGTNSLLYKSLSTSDKYKAFAFIKSNKLIDNNHDERMRALCNAIIEADGEIKF